MVNDPYDVAPYIAEVYDQSETDPDDMHLLRRLVGGHVALRILELFCGTGRLLLPLAEDGHTVVGVDHSLAMLHRAHTKVEALPKDTRGRVSLVEADVRHTEWPAEFDLVVLGANSLCELASPEEQADCIARAAAALKPGGYLYLDNTHMEGDLDPQWQVKGKSAPVLGGTCDDGTSVAVSREIVWFNAEQRLVRLRYKTEMTRPDGGRIMREHIQQKHLISTEEMKRWLRQNNLMVVYHYGDHEGNPYTPQAPRAIFWAQQV